GEGKAKQPERELRGNEAAEKLLDGFAPLRAERALGAVDAAKLKEFGLADPEPDTKKTNPDGGVAAAPPAKKPQKRRFEVTARGETRAFTVGAQGVSFNPYVRDERDGKVYLL